MGDSDPSDPPRYVSPLKSSSVEYTPEELALIESSKVPSAEGAQKRTTIRDLHGRSYTLAGLNRFPGDFTVPASFPLAHIREPPSNPQWIRAPDPGEPPEFPGGWFVREKRKGHLAHPNAKPIRHADTMGMFPGGMTMVFNSRNPEEVREEVASQAAANPGILDTLVDDIEPGASPRRTAA